MRETNNCDFSSTEISKNIAKTVLKPDLDRLLHFHKPRGNDSLGERIFHVAKIWCSEIPTPEILGSDTFCHLLYCKQ